MFGVLGVGLHGLKTITLRGYRNRPKRCVEAGRILRNVAGSRAGMRNVYCISAREKRVAHVQLD